MRINKINMATYKKRGYKPKTTVEKEVEVEDSSTTAEVFNTLDESANKAEEFVEKNQKNIFIIIGVAAAFALAYLGYQQFIVKPKQGEAMNEMYQAQKFFNEAVVATVGQDSLYNLALTGGEGKLGLVDIASQFSGTAAGNLANYYAGMAYFNTNDYQNAVTYLDAFDSEDEALGPIAKGVIGDAYAQTNEKSNALDYYKKAANLRQNEFSTPTYLFKAGVTALDMGDASEALELLNKIKDNYPNSPEATQAEVFIGKAQAMSN
ncbi:tetratricopeptide repeat protein [Psychroserpens sp. NJDZ02]|uniref:tetratricopeptide repeat protein n=1 Tax=Psychroserpens sp. NJDZ02 TaxID=2570561 RepID=UPI002938D9AF|nr:tetratricopeptide repeat protein [Psychroserpens sp. NJDZ02]